MTFMPHYNPKKNQEGYDDPTTFAAMQKVDNDPEQKELNCLIKMITKIASYAGYSIENRLILKNKKTGKIWR